MHTTILNAHIATGSHMQLGKGILLGGGSFSALFITRFTISCLRTREVVALTVKKSSQKSYWIECDYDRQGQLDALGVRPQVGYQRHIGIDDHKTLFGHARRRTAANDLKEYDL